MFLNISGAASGKTAGVSVITSVVLSSSFKLACRYKKQPVNSCHYKNAQRYVKLKYESMGDASVQKVIRRKRVFCIYKNKL